MISAQILDTLGTIDERYVAEYQAQKSAHSGRCVKTSPEIPGKTAFANFTSLKEASAETTFAEGKPTKAVSSKVKGLRRLALAACLLAALTLLVGPAVLHHLNGSGSYGYLSQSISYDVFKELMPEDTPLTDLEDNGFTIKSCEVIYSDAFTGGVPSGLETEDCHSFIVEAEKNVGETDICAVITCLLESPLETVANYVDTMEVSFPEDTTETVQISDMSVYVSCVVYPEEDEQDYDYYAAFQVGDVIYEARFYDAQDAASDSINRDIVIEFMTELLS
ncbi:MAG: hypothetical protein LUE29_10440 [Lachnospiraceae bacterium]|nr:hypothetical protein [Lachnospiraceae bacterium]